MSATVVRYSESFKLQVVRDLESGRFANIGQAATHYGIRGSVTIRGWLIKFGKDRLMPRVVRVETPDEQHELKRLRQRVRQLEGLLADKELGLVISETYLELACERAGIADVEDFKKRPLGVRTARGRAARAKGEDAMCAALGMSRQNYYRQRQRRQRRTLQEEAVLAWTREERQVQPKLGARKLLHRMKEQRRAFVPGRDRYLALLKKKDMLVSYENAHAERVNGILKREYALGQVLPSLEAARKTADQAMELYNTRRPHWSLNLGYPAKIHEEGLENFSSPCRGMKGPADAGQSSNKTTNNPCHLLIRT